MKVFEFLLKKKTSCQELKSTYLIKTKPKSPHCFLRVKKIFIFRIHSVMKEFFKTFLWKVCSYCYWLSTEHEASQFAQGKYGKILFMLITEFF